MAQLWGGRFTKETDKEVFDFNASIGFDKRLFAFDIKGSLAHAEMLCKIGILTKEEFESIQNGLNEIIEEVRDGKLEFTEEYEDVHSFVESNLTMKIGDAGKKLHTGRSRNDQVALDMKLYTRDDLKSMKSSVVSLLDVILQIIKDNTETYMPGFTHMQKAQPVTLAHHFAPYFEMFSRDEKMDKYEPSKYINKRCL